MSGDNSVPISLHLISSWHFCLLRFNLQFKKVIISSFFVQSPVYYMAALKLFIVLVTVFRNILKHEGRDLNCLRLSLRSFSLCFKLHKFTVHTQQTFVNTESINSNELFSPPVHCGPDLIVLCILLISKTTRGSGQLSPSI